LRKESAMAKDNQIKVLFLDIGGVLLTNGWDHKIRRCAADIFDLDYDEIDKCHNQVLAELGLRLP
jgi:putative hydrolase of the HAD superfamily